MSGGNEWTYKPLPVYNAFHRSGVRHRLLAGGFGSGKTIALCADAIASGLRVPGARILMTRKTIPELRDTLEPEFLNLLPPDLYARSRVRRSGGHISSITFPNGTQYLFKSIPDWQELKSLNLARIYWDELSEFDLATYTGVTARMRQTVPTAEAKELGYHDPIPEWFRGSAAATNPAGHDWMWERWIKDPMAEHEHWVATSLDNPYLPEDYYENLFAMPDAWVRRYVLCSFDEFGGLIYPDWGERHIYQGTLELNKLTPIFHGYDPGQRHPTGMLWVAHTEGKLIAVHEELAADTDLDTWVKKVRRVEAKLPPVKWRVADPNRIHVRDQGTSVSLHAQWRRKGFHFYNGPSQHKDRIPMLGTLIKSGRFMVTRNCMTTFDQIQAYRWEDLTATMRDKMGSHAEDYGPEKPVKVYDDLTDCAQYLSSRLVRPVKELTPDDADTRTAWQRQSDELTGIIKRRRSPRPRGALPAGTIV